MIDNYIVIMSGLFICLGLILHKILEGNKSPLDQRPPLLYNRLLYLYYGII